MPTIETILLQEDFEGGALPASFTDYYDKIGGVSINANLAFVHSGAKSLKCHFAAASGDLAETVWKIFSPREDHLLIRSYLYIVTPVGTVNVQRKLYYWKADRESPLHWWGGVTTEAPAGSPVLRVWTNGTGGIPSVSYESLATLNWDTWYHLEVEVQANTPGLLDGAVRLWVNGGNVLNQAGLNLRGSYTEGIQELDIGAETNGGASSFNDDRYWDDIVISRLEEGPSSSASRRRRRRRRMLGEL